MSADNFFTIRNFSKDEKYYWDILISYTTYLFRAVSFTINGKVHILERERLQEMAAKWYYDYLRDLSDTRAIYDLLTCSCTYSSSPEFIVFSEEECALARQVFTSVYHLLMSEDWFREWMLKDGGV